MKASLLHRRHHPAGRGRRDERVPAPRDRSQVSPAITRSRDEASSGEVRPDVERVREAIGGSTRRTVVRSAAWSVPVIAAVTAAPSFAASTGTICTACNGAQPTACTVGLVVGQPIPPGQCRCSDGLVCVTVGPLNLANVCVATGLVTTQCGPTTCTGICVAAGGGVITAVNTLTATLTTALALINVGNCSAGVTGFLPGNICTVPVTNVNAGNFGALCITNTGGGLIGGTASTAVNLLKTTVAALGIAGLAFANQCASPYACRAGVRATAQPGTVLGCGLGNSLDLTVGFCQC